MHNYCGGKNNATKIRSPPAFMEMRLEMPKKKTLRTTTRPRPELPPPNVGHSTADGLIWGLPQFEKVPAGQLEPDVITILKLAIDAGTLAEDEPRVLALIQKHEPGYSRQ